MITFIGLLKLMGWIYYSLCFIKRIFFTRPLDLLSRYNGKNTWAVITGSSDGIGADMAKRFAKRGFNIVLMGRVRSKLNSIEAEIRKINPKV